MRRSCKDPGCIQTPCVKTLNTCVIEGAWLEALVLGVSGGGLVVGGGNGGGCCHPLGGKGGGFGRSLPWLSSLLPGGSLPSWEGLPEASSPSSDRFVEGSLVVHRPSSRGLEAFCYATAVIHLSTSQPHLGYRISNHQGHLVIDGKFRFMSSSSPRGVSITPPHGLRRLVAPYPGTG